jgi:hypothetical protein
MTHYMFYTGKHVGGVGIYGRKQWTGKLKQQKRQSGDAVTRINVQIENSFFLQMNVLFL